MKNEMIISLLPDDIYLSCVNLAGTHDSATAYVSFSKWAKCQLNPIDKQLETGVRLLDIRLCKKGENFFLVHSTADCFENSEKTEKLTFDTALRYCVEFLKNNPKETIVMSVKKDRGFKGIFDKLFFSAFYKKYIAQNRDIWFTENRVPQLRECRGKIVLMRRCKRRRNFESSDTCGLNFSVWKNQKSARDVEPFEVVLNNDYRATVQDSYSVEPRAKRELSKKCMENIFPSEKHIAVHFLSTSGYGGPTKTADFLNESFTKFKMKESQPTGWVFFDFQTEELCSKISESNKTIYKV